MVSPAHGIRNLSICIVNSDDGITYATSRTDCAFFRFSEFHENGHVATISVTAIYLSIHVKFLSAHPLKLLGIVQKCIDGTCLCGIKCTYLYSK